MREKRKNTAFIFSGRRGRKAAEKLRELKKEMNRFDSNLTDEEVNTRLNVKGNNRKKLMGKLWRARKKNAKKGEKIESRNANKTVNVGNLKKRLKENAELTDVRHFETEEPNEE